MTTAAAILDASIDRALANDEGTSDLASDRAALLGVLNRITRRIYSLAGVPLDGGGYGKTPYFTTRASFSVPGGGALVAITTLPMIYVVGLRTVSGQRVGVQSIQDEINGTLDFPPVMILENGQVRSASRLGDPVAAASLTAIFSYAPPDMALETDTIGALTPSDPTTSRWPAHAGDQFLIDGVALHLSVRDHTRSETEIGVLKAEIELSARALSQVLGVDAVALTTTLEA